VSTLNAEHYNEHTTGLTGVRKTNVLVSEIKKHYKLNMLKNFIDQEAINAKGQQTSATPVKAFPASKSAITKVSEDKTANHTAN